ncbi:30S ribosomal protein S7 [Anaplasma phagocytophilum]|uniref:Small ribosomal subunit protein uS7 n=10 Tax=Anaplasma phagocytophilum TaxID=948 RepID=RS7_ANAPZ|nr:30S ribosomal protein S7 [Anaplasma phagocytophilum]Q2GJ59.1 RecName: Full=Small ribosomal subunit protein uS7; AltName: Full=30S ribosomal protein S7 [Anaplasma phagocytophilum str. HZ]KJV63734.1 ribosomal protein S7 [Anaplasma phagocytophilum str. ApMUC09]KJV67269.1 ribosomal protein S7 [Anaplasma phagocytophilum str. ApNP]KJZ99519.1 ribosomal protein S7 [Anaplasma phagocytophilum str. CR1007]ABD43745.1 ribosomal protein S7 [Anaplasma phagocytophilum str. HZ]AGR78996.1 30S ribosomal prot
MSRRRRVVRRAVATEGCSGNVLLARFVNVVMHQGKKALAEKIVFGALKMAESRLQGESGIAIFNTAVANVMPKMEVRSRRVGGVTYQIPVEVREDRSTSLALRWIVKAARASRKRTNKTYMSCLCHELMEAYNKRGGACKIKEEKYRMAEANKAFSHFRF